MIDCKKILTRSLLSRTNFKTLVSEMTMLFSTFRIILNTTNISLCSRKYDQIILAYEAFVRNENVNKGRLIGP